MKTFIAYGTATAVVIAVAVTAIAFNKQPTNAKLGDVIHETMACAKLDDLKHAQSLGDGDTGMAALIMLQYAINHDCTTIREGTMLRVDDETEGYACIRIDDEACRWTTIRNIEIQELPASTKKSQDDLQSTIERTIKEQQQ
jgi:hypothetical protein